MYSENQFFALEAMCRERAAIATREREYWLAEAEEWARFRLSCKATDERPVNSLVPSDRPLATP
jgi:hypothetical protein